MPTELRKATVPPSNSKQRWPLTNQINVHNDDTRKSKEIQMQDTARPCLARPRRVLKIIIALHKQPSVHAATPRAAIATQRKHMAHPHIRQVVTSTQRVARHVSWRNIETYFYKQPIIRHEVLPVHDWQLLMRQGANLHSPLNMSHSGTPPWNS